MKKRDQELEWKEGIPDRDGLYDYRGALYALDSDAATSCTPSCRLNLRTGDGLRVDLYGEDGREYDITRTGDGKWRGPVGPLHIPAEDARRAGGE